MQKFIILCIIRISNFTAGVTTRPVCFSLADCCSRPQCRTTEQWSVYLIALVHPVCILTRLHRHLVKFDPVAGLGLLWHVCTPRGDRRDDAQSNCRCDSRADRSRRPSPRLSPHVMRFCLVNRSAGSAANPYPLCT